MVALMACAVKVTAVPAHTGPAGEAVIFTPATRGSISSILLLKGWAGILIPVSNNITRLKNGRVHFNLVWICFAIIPGLCIMDLRIIAVLSIWYMFWMQFRK